MAFPKNNSPVVTGVSPKDGLPGTKIIIRGENFGNSASDLVCLTICDCDCTLSAEWKSPNKIIARSGPGKGLGDVLVTTRLGGLGTCTVKFRGYTEAVGPTKESAVWVDTPASLNWARRSLSPSSYHQHEDPLGLSVEAAEKAIPEDDLNEMFPGRCGDLGSDQFSAGWFLLENHHTTSFDDLKAGLAHMKRNIDNQNRGGHTFLKANVSSVLDQLDTLVKLKERYDGDAKTFPDFTSRVLRKIEDTKDEAHQLFQEVLLRRERADTTRNGLAVLQRFKFLFCLPAVIEQNALKGDFDVIINDYARVKHLFGSSEVTLFQKVLGEIETHIEGVREILIKKLNKVNCSSIGAIDELMKIIRNLVFLDAAGDVAWTGVTSYANHLEQALNDLKDKYIILETSENAKKKKSSQKKQVGKPPRVLFVEELVDLIEMSFPDLWKLGQTYFRGEFLVDIDPANPTKFKGIVLNCITLFCQLLRAAILPHTLLRNAQTRQLYGTWSNSGYDAVLLWLPHCLRYFRGCYSCFIRLDLPSDVLDLFSTLVFDLRLFIVSYLFKQASVDINALTQSEDWTVERHDVFGGITRLPNLFEAILRKVVQSAHETVMIGEVREAKLMDNQLARDESLTALEGLFNSFADVLEILAFVVDDEQSKRSAVVSQLVGTSDLAKTSDSRITWEQRLLIVRCNCEFTVLHVVPSLAATITSSGFPATPQSFISAKQVFISLSQKILDQYHENKCDPLVGTIEPSMFFPKFEWDSCIPPTDIRPYAKEIIVNLIGVRAELHKMPPSTARIIMSKIVETVAEEIARLMSCVKKFSREGSLQATSDVSALQEALKSYLTPKSNRFFTEALQNIPAITKDDKLILQSTLENFKCHMALQLLCLEDTYSS